MTRSRDLANLGRGVGVADLKTGTDGELITWDSDGNPATIAVGTAGHVLTSNGAGAAPTFQSHLPDIIILEDQKADGTDGGTATSGAWRTRDLDTEVSDSGGHASLSSNQITLAPGTYDVDIESVFGALTGGTRLRLYNTTDTSAEIISPSYSFGNEQTYVMGRTIRLHGRITLAASKVLEVQYNCQATANNTGLGNDDGITAGVEIYTRAIFRKVA